MQSELHIPSDLRYLSVVENWLLGCLEKELGDRVDWPRQASRFRLVLVEAYSNVVRHAHRERPNLPVLVRLDLRDRNIALEIWDYGEGYMVESYDAPEPTAMREGGYGWLIMQRLMDQVEYALQIDGRNRLKLQTSLPEQEPSPEQA